MHAKPERIKELAQKGFALLIAETRPGTSPDANDVQFTLGEILHKCLYEDKVHGRITGEFYECEVRGDACGTAYIDEVVNPDGSGTHLHPSSSRYYAGIIEKYAAMKKLEHPDPPHNNLIDRIHSA